MKLKKVKIVIQSLDDLKSEWKDALKGKVRGVERKGSITFLSLEAVAKVLSQPRLEILAAILKDHPKSIYALAKLIDRDFKNVHSDVKLLADVGLIELRTSGKKRSAVMPVARYSGLELDLAA
jgi:predicted transcriptional regulator